PRSPPLARGRASGRSRRKTTPSGASPQRRVRPERGTAAARQGPDPRYPPVVAALSKAVVRPGGHRRSARFERASPIPDLPYAIRAHREPGRERQAEPTRLSQSRDETEVTAGAGPAEQEDALGGDLLRHNPRRTAHDSKLSEGRWPLGS